MTKITQPKLCVYHLDPELVQAALDELKTLPYEDVYEVIGHLLMEHTLAQSRPYEPEEGIKTLRIKQTKKEPLAP